MSLGQARRNRLTYALTTLIDLQMIYQPKHFIFLRLI